MPRSARRRTRTPGRAGADRALDATVEVVGGVRDPDSTTLELQKTPSGGGTKSFGVAKLVKEQGVWKIVQDNWR